MTRILRNRAMIAAALAVSVAIPLTSLAAQDAEPAGEQVALTIYNQGTALVQDRRVFTFDEGVSTINFTDVAAGIDPTSVQFVSLTDPSGTFVLEQNYVYDLVNSGALLERYLDQQIQITTNDGTVFIGQLLSGRNGEVILRDASGQVFVVSLSNVRDIQFPELPGGLITRPTLRWLVQASAAGEQTVELTYLTSGMNWSADYVVLLENGNTALDLNGWVTLNNGTGTAFTDAIVKLVAGDVNRLPVEGRIAEAELMMMDSMAAAPSSQVAQREFYEYQLYEIQRPVTVGANETKQVEFVSGIDVPANTIYVYNASQPYYGYPIYDQYYDTGITTVSNFLEFSTGEENGLGADLPAGRMRVYQEDVDGSALLIGENQIGHTPMGEDVRILLGNAFDLVGERVQTDFRMLGNTVLEETYSITLRNRKDDETVVIRVPENLFRWTNWEILASSVPFERTSANTIEFAVEVPPNGETVLTYTVRYTFPQ
jgi:hypothetical protein